MSKIIEQSYLLNEQYKDATNLDARVRLHVLFSTNQYGWHRWCFDHYTLPEQAHVLEIGCGPAYLWAANLDRLPPGWRETYPGRRAASFDFPSFLPALAAVLLRARRRAANSV